MFLEIDKSERGLKKIKDPRQPIMRAKKTKRKTANNNKKEII